MENKMIKITRTVDGETFEPSLIMKNNIGFR